ncbi:hypothetical protein ACQR1H_19005 [Bradyrhizobium sp. HKCCYLRH2015]
MATGLQIVTQRLVTGPVKMTVLVGLLALFLSASAVQADQIVLACIGSINYPANPPTKIDGDSAVVDFDSQTFKPPIFPAYKITKISNTNLSFGLDTSETSVFGSIDRISGNVSMTVMRPEERKKILSGGSAKMLSWMTAKCSPAKRMF